MLERFSNLSFTPDLTIIVVVFAIALYGLLLGRNKIKTLALSVYVGYVIATELGLRLHDFLAGRQINVGTNPVMIGLFIAPLIILELGRREHIPRGGHRGGMIMTMVLAVLTSALVVSSGLKLLDPDTLQKTLGNSSLATAIYGLRLWWVGLVPLAIIGENFIRPKDH